MPVVDCGYTLVIGDDEKSFRIRMDSFSLNLVAGKDGKHSSSSCSVAIRGSEALPAIMYESGLVEAKILDKEGNILFTGVIRPYASITANQMHLGDFLLEVIDYTEKLHKKVYAEPDNPDDLTSLTDVIFEKHWDNCKVCDPQNQDDSIVHKICALAGIAIVEAPAINVTLNRFSLEAGNYLDDVLGTLLYEYVYDYRFDESGSMHIYQTGVIIETTYDSTGHAISTEHNLVSKKTIEKFINSLDISRSDDARKGVLVKYNKYKTRTNVLLWEDSMEGWPGVASYNSGWWTFDKDIRWDLSDITEDDSGEELILSNFYPQGENLSWGIANAKLEEYSLTECNDEGGHLSFRVGAGGGLFFAYCKYVMRVYADVSYLKAESQTVGYAGDDAEEYSARYIEKVEYALSIATAIRNRCEYGAFEYKFKSFEVIEPGAVVTLREVSISGLETTARITKRSLSNDYGLYEYEAEGYGETEFTAPTIDRDEDSDSPSAQPDFFLMNVSESNVIPDEEDNIPIYAEAWGTIFSKYGAIPRWYLNGTLLSGYTSLSISFSKQMLAPGINRLKVEADYDGETYVLERPINYISADFDIQMQFAVVPKGESPDSSTIWLDTQPTPGANEAVWMRFRTSTSNNWIVVKMTAEDGGNPVVYFQWAATPYIKPDDGYDILTWGESAITWEISDVMGFILQSGGWETLVPEKPAGLNYLWVKYWNYQEEQWDYFCTTGTPAMDFNLIVNPQTYRLTSRGVTQESSDYNDHCQRINVRCQRLNTTAPISWEITPNDERLFRWERVDDSDDSQIVIIINPMVALPTINIHCAIADIDTAKDFVVSGIQEGKADIIYMGVISSTASFPTETSEGPLMVGDHVLVETEEGNRTPYYWNGAEWVVSNRNTPVEIAWKISENTLYDALQAPGTVDSQSVINQFVANLAAYHAFIFNLKVRHLLVGDGSLSSGFRFEIFDYEDGEKVSPVARCLYDGKSVFQINPETGNVFFGQVNDIGNPVSIEKGFMYDAASGEIRGPVRERFYIDQNGNLHATNVSISGDIDATSGSFSGLLKTTTIETRESSLSDVYIYLSAGKDQARTIFQRLEEAGYPVTSTEGPVEFPGKSFFTVESSAYPEIKYIRVNKNWHDGYNNSTAWGVRYIVMLYDKNFNQLKASALENFSGTLGSTDDLISRVVDPSLTGPVTGSEEYNLEINDGNFLNTSFSLVVSPGQVLIIDVPVISSTGDIELENKQVYIDSSGNLKVYLKS